MLSLGGVMEEGPNIYQVAEKMVQQLGPAAYPYLCEQAEIAKLTGDRDSAITWWDIALAVVEIMSTPATAIFALIIGLVLA